MPDDNIALTLLAADTANASEASSRLAALDGQSRIIDADVVVALRGGGFILLAMPEKTDSGCALYGMNRGTIGFLMNEYGETGLTQRIAAATAETIRPLVMEVETADGFVSTGRAINEVSLFRQSAQAAKINITIDGKLRMEGLIC